MKHSDYKRMANQKPGFRDATEELQLVFAFGDAVLNARIERGWSQAELARRSGTKQANISRIEAGLANPTLDLVYRLCRALEIDVRFSARTEPSPILYADRSTLQMNFQHLNEASEDSYPPGSSNCADEDHTAQI